MKFAYYASGFREKRGNLTGTKQNSRAVRDTYQSGDCAVIYVEWDDDPKEYAKDLANQWQPGDTIILTGYSWGAGNWAYKFLWALWRANPLIEVRDVFFVDPVVRSRYPWMRWLAVSDHGTIELPPNVAAFRAVRQDKNEPNASNVRIGDILFRRNDFKKLNCTHSEIDNHEAVARITLNVAKKYLSNG